MHVCMPMCTFFFRTGSSARWTPKFNASPGMQAMQFRSSASCIHYTVPLVAISPRQATNPLEYVKTKGNGAAEECSGSTGNPNSKLGLAAGAQPSLCVHMKAAGAQESSTSVMLVMRKLFN